MRSTKPTYEVRSWFCCALRSAFRAKRPSLQPSSGVPPNWNRVPCLSSSWKGHAVMIEENTLLHMSISIILRHLLGSLRSPFFGTGTHWLFRHALWSVFPSKKLETCLCTIHLGASSIALRASEGMPLRPGAFPFFSLLMARLTSQKMIGVSMAVWHGFWLMSSRTESSTGLWLLRTLWKC